MAFSKAITPLDWWEIEVAFKSCKNQETANFTLSLISELVPTYF